MRNAALRRDLEHLSEKQTARLLDPLFTTDTMREIFSDRRRLQGMLDFEAALARALVRAGVAPAEAVGGYFCEDCHVADIVDGDELMRGGVRPYALDAQTAKALWKKSEEMVGESF